MALNVHGDRHAPGGPDPLTVRGYIAFDFDNEGASLDITTTGSDGDGYGIHLHDTGSTQGIKVESDSRNVELDAGDNLILSASQAITIENVNALIEFDPLGGGGITMQVSPSTGNLGIAFKDHAGTSMLRMRDFVISTQAVFDTTTLGFFNTSAVAQQGAPSSAQDIANALHAYGLLSGAGTVSSGGAGIITDGTTTVNPATQLDFTSGATVTDAGGGVAQVAITGGGSGIVFATGNSGTYLEVTTTGSNGASIPIYLHDTDVGGNSGITIQSDNNDVTLQTAGWFIQAAGTAAQMADGNSLTPTMILLSSPAGTNEIKLALDVGGVFHLYDNSGNLMLEMTDGSPDMHIKTGGTVVADL